MFYYITLVALLLFKQANYQWEYLSEK